MAKRLSERVVIAARAAFVYFYNNIGRLPFETNILMLHGNDNKIKKRVAARKNSNKTYPNIHLERPLTASRRQRGETRTEMCLKIDFLVEH